MRWRAADAEGAVVAEAAAVVELELEVAGGTEAEVAVGAARRRADRPR